MLCEKGRKRAKKDEKQRNSLSIFFSFSVFAVFEADLGFRCRGGHRIPEGGSALRQGGTLLRCLAVRQAGPRPRSQAGRTNSHGTPKRGNGRRQGMSPLLAARTRF